MSKIGYVAIESLYWTVPLATSLASKKILLDTTALECHVYFEKKKTSLNKYNASFLSILRSREKIDSKPDCTRKTETTLIKTF